MCEVQRTREIFGYEGLICFPFLELMLFLKRQIHFKEESGIVNEENDNNNNTEYDGMEEEEEKKEEEEEEEEEIGQPIA